MVFYTYVARPGKTLNGTIVDERETYITPALDYIKFEGHPDRCRILANTINYLVLRITNEISNGEENDAPKDVSDWIWRIFNILRKSTLKTELPNEEITKLIDALNNIALKYKNKDPCVWKEGGIDHHSTIVIIDAIIGLLVQNDRHLAATKRILNEKRYRNVLRLVGEANERMPSSNSKKIYIKSNLNLLGMK